MWERWWSDFVGFVWVFGCGCGCDNGYNGGYNENRCEKGEDEFFVVVVVAGVWDSGEELFYFVHDWVGEEEVESGEKMCGEDRKGNDNYLYCWV